MDEAVLVPGGYINYRIEYSNHGNVTTTMRITDTLPSGLSYQSAWWGGNSAPLPEPIIIGNQVIWDLDGLGVNDQRVINIHVLIDETVEPVIPIENCVAATGDGPDSYPEDNHNCFSVMIYPPGPNLQVEKWHEWHGDGQLSYTVQFANLGDQPVEGVWITDTLPLGTTSNGEFDLQYEQERLETFTHTLGNLVWGFTEINSGEKGWLFFNADLDDPGLPLSWFTNTVQITTLPEDTHPGDNWYEDVAFSGGEVRVVHIWLTLSGDSSVWGEAVPGSVVTVTTSHAIYNAWADPECSGCWNVDDTGQIIPGELITVEAGNGQMPVEIEVPDPFDVEASSITDEVWGQVDHLDGVWIDIERYGGPTIPTQADGNGFFSANFPDIPRGGEGEVRFYTQVDYTDVIFHRHWRSPDLFLDINYGHDWVQGAYEAGHTVWITVTESDGDAVKGVAVLTTGMIPGWETSGFSTDWDGWLGDRPDIIPGDWVFGRVDNGFTGEVRVGTIFGDLDVETDRITGWLEPPWFVGEIDFLDVECYPWGAWELGIEAEVKYSIASPDGGIPYFCHWDPASEWDILLGQNLGVAYLEPDGDRVINAFLEFFKIYLPLVIR